MERIVRRSYGHDNGPKSAEKISKGKTHGQTKKPCTGRIQGKKEQKEKPPEKVRRLKATRGGNTSATGEHLQPTYKSDTGQRQRAYTTPGQGHRMQGLPEIVK